MLLGSMEKERLKRLLAEQKMETVQKNMRLMMDYMKEYDYECSKEYDIDPERVWLQRCKTTEEKKRWAAYVHWTSSLPWRGAVGRQVRFFVRHGNSDIIGMVHLASAAAMLVLRDRYFGWTYEEKWEEKKINSVYSMGTCVPMPNNARFLAGKLLVYCMFSVEIKEFLEAFYGDEVVGIESTSLYGKSSMYNRIPFFKYLGLTQGRSAVCVSDEDWKKCKEEYYKYVPHANRSLKFQLLDKLRDEYYKRGKRFPYAEKRYSYRRGVYVGTEFEPLDKRVGEWYDRWYVPRKERLADGIRGA